MTVSRLLTALLVAPLVGALATSILSGAFAAFDALRTGHSPLVWFFSQARSSFARDAAVIYVFTATFGLAFHAVAQIVHVQNGLLYSGGGALLGFLVIVLVGLVSAGSGTPAVDLIHDIGLYAPSGIVGGATTALAAWAIRFVELPQP